MSDHPEQIATPENSINMVGREGPYGTINMGGMFTVLKVREHLTSYADPGWYQPPAGTVAQKASRQDLERDGIKV
jgi:manganese oxidase